MTAEEMRLKEGLLLSGMRSPEASGGLRLEKDSESGCLFFRDRTNGIFLKSANIGQLTFWRPKCSMFFHSFSSDRTYIQSTVRYILFNSLMMKIISTQSHVLTYILNYTHHLLYRLYVLY